MSVKLTNEPFHLRPFTERRRLSAPRLNHQECMYPYDHVAGVPSSFGQIHRNLWTSAFPYRRAADYPGHLEVQNLPVIRLEDDHSRVTILPSMAGRVIEIFDKGLNRQLLWSPPSLKLGNLSLSGPHTIGGIEFNPFRYGHNVHGISTIEVRQVTLQDGREAVALGAFDELFGCEWEVILALENGTLVSRMTITNHSGKDQPCLYWWTCIAVPLQWRDHIMMAPGDFLHHAMFRQGYEFDQWPMVHGVDWSQWLHQHEVVSGYLANTRSDFMGYTNDKENWSFVHRADRSVCRGRKLWSLGSQGAHQSWWQTLAEPNWAPYAELQSGLLPVQPDTGILTAGQSISWTEAFTSVQGSATEPTYGENFTAFERRGLEKTGSAWESWNGPDFWQVQGTKTLVDADTRLAISKKLILTGTLSEEEIHQAVDTGWVGGDQWIALLEEKQPSLTGNARLALAVAKINQNALGDARKILLPLTDSHDETSAYSNHFLGLLAAENDNADEACARLHRSVSEGYANTHLLTNADQVFARFGRHAERTALWEYASVETRTSDDYRLAQASLAFLDGNWSSVRSLLTAPLLSIAEGATYPWFLFKESFFGEFAEKISEGDFQGALDALASGSQTFPQFGIGRQEDRQNVDFLFYRYQICTLQGWHYLESAFANMILLEPEYPGSPEALYVYRVAKTENDPTASARLKAIETWNNSSPGWQKHQPLRWALNQQTLHNSASGWHDLADHPLYRYRAQFELANFQDSTASDERQTNTSRPLDCPSLQEVTG